MLDRSSHAQLKDALAHLGVPLTSKQAEAILLQYDRYPDLTIDVKEFAAIVKDVKLLLAFDTNSDGVLDAEELLPCLQSLGLDVDLEQVAQILRRFDVDNSGSINLLELSSLVRTSQAFLRYDVDHNGSIDVDELRDALRKLGLRAGTLEAQTLFRRYDADASGTIDLAEFAVLVADLQLFASFDTNSDGSIDAAELGCALSQLGLKHPASESAVEAEKVLHAWDQDQDVRTAIVPHQRTRRRSGAPHSLAAHRFAHEPASFEPLRVGRVC